MVPQLDREQPWGAIDERLSVDNVRAIRAAVAAVGTRVPGGQSCERKARAADLTGDGQVAAWGGAPPNLSY